MAIGSAPEIGVEFLTHDGKSKIHYPWIVDGVVRQLMYGEATLGFVRGLEGNVYPPDGDFVWCRSSRDQQTTDSLPTESGATIRDDGHHRSPSSREGETVVD